MTKHRLPRHIALPGPADGIAIGLMGGSFDPPHSGHAHVRDVALARLGLDWIWILPAAGNPLKKTFTPYRDRLTAAHNRLSAPRAIVSDLEARLRRTYSIDLIRDLKRRAPNARFVWIIGADNLANFHRWKQWREIAKLIPIAVVSRPGASPKAGLSHFARQFGGYRIAPSAARTLADHRPPAWVYITAPMDDASSTELRALMASQLLSPIPMV